MRGRRGGVRGGSRGALRPDACQEVAPPAGKLMRAQILKTRIAAPASEVLHVSSASASSRRSLRPLRRSAR